MIKPIIIPRKDHTISRKNISKAALKVLYRLNQKGYKSYLVGGAVRDLLLNRKPKDYDVVTDARPRVVKNLFRNSFLIGRRFRLVHVKFKHRTIEVSTFRRTPKQQHNPDGDLLVKRENTFGSREEDALRRDFTVNALFYNIDDFSVIDYAGGLKDLQSNLIRSIGDPDTRFQEDPVRIIRAIRIAARLKFYINQPTWDAMKRHSDGISRCPPARILEEIYQLIRNGSAVRSMQLLYQTRLMQTLLPGLYEFWRSRNGQKIPVILLEQLDNLSTNHPCRTPPLMLAAMFYPIIPKSDLLTIETAFKQQVESLLEPLVKSMNVPKRQHVRLIQICTAQQYFGFKQRKKSKYQTMINRDYFPEALTLANMRMNANPDQMKNQRQFWKTKIEQTTISDENKKEMIRIINFRPRKN